MADLAFYKMHALIVDDFESFRATLSKMLMDFGIGQVDAVASGEEALRCCKARSYDLILCDNNLGKGKSGQQVLEQLRVRHNPCADSLFILLSAESSKNIIMAAYDYEPDAYLAKPITPKAMEQRLKRLFEQRIALTEVQSAQKRGDDNLAIKVCNTLIEQGSRYTNQCQKILGQLYLKQGSWVEAESLYRSVLENRELEWAQLGMVKAKLAQGDLLGAQQWLENILQSNPLCMKAYDLQAELFELQNNTDALQEILQRATELSPLSILRQQRLGSVAQQNNDLLTAATALKRAVKLGENSCFDQASIHTQFAQASIDLFGTDAELARPLLKEAMVSMQQLENRFGKANSTKAQALLLESQLHQCSGDQRRAQALLADAQALLPSLTDAGLVTAQIELVRTLRLLGHGDAAQDYLVELVQQYASDEKQLQRLDVLLDEPRSEKNKLMVAEINKKGIAHYNASDFSAAAEAFKTAMQKLPNHVGLRLNYIQAVIDKLKINFDPALAEKTQQILVKTGTLTQPEHQQFQRYRQLKDSFSGLLKAQHKNV